MTEYAVPWTAAVDACRVVDARGHTVADLPVGSYRGNARLIAAAPDLLAALVRVLGAYEADRAMGVAFGNDQAADQARAAIAKAEATP